MSPEVRQALDLLQTQPEKTFEIAVGLLRNDEKNLSVLMIAVRALLQLGKFTEAEKYINKVEEYHPRHIDAFYARASLFEATGRSKAAEKILSEALKMDPHNLIVLGLQAVVLKRVYKYDQAEAVWEELVRAEPDNAIHWSNLGALKLDVGLFKEADFYLKKGAQIGKGYSSPFFNRISTWHYWPDKTAEQILALCKAWQPKLFPAGNVVRAEANSKVANKRIRIGMISAGFRRHPVGNMITLGLSHIPSSQIEFYAYSEYGETNNEDDITQRIKEFCTQWKVTKSLTDEALAQQIRQDEIDILFDLSGYGGGTRVLTMLRAPAPIQIKWVGGLISSTGLAVMDYLLSDGVETPPGVDGLYTEKLIRLPDDYICYDPPAYLPEVTALPAAQRGYITFGCFNNASKINDVLLEQWAKILHAVPDSRLFLKSRQYSSQKMCERIYATLQKHGIERERIETESYSPHQISLSRYNEIDIALDSWPYSGGLTTCEAMAMGVPVVTLPGPTFAGRHSATHLVNAGMPELVANNWEQYIDITVGLTRDLASLSVIRQHLRDILLASPVCDGKRFARHFSDAMRAIWQRYCEGKKPEALTLSNDFLPYFHDDKQPVTLQHPMEENTDKNDADAPFDFKLAGKIIALDDGGSIAVSPSFTPLVATEAFHFVITDLVGRVQNSHFPLRKNDIQHVKFHGLGDGQPTPVYMCLAEEYSSNLKPLVTQQQRVIAEVMAQTVKLDHIDGLEQLDWLILDNRYDIGKVIANGERILSNCLAVEVHISFAATHQNQQLFSDITALLAQYGFAFHTLTKIEYASPTHIDERNTLPSSRMLAAAAVYVPNDARLHTMTVELREKLAFIMHTVYRAHDFVYSVLKIDSEERAKRYFNDYRSSKADRASPAAPEMRGIPLIPDRPRMSEKEIQLFERYLKQAKSYFEFGSGGSTKLAAKNDVEIFGVESDKQWVETLKKEGGPLCKVEYVDIGPTQAWGYPVNNTYREKYPDYSEAILQYDSAFDFILVDGRFRIACTLNAIKHTLEKQKNIADTLIFIHDFWNRPNYHAVLMFLDIEEKVDSAGVFKLKNHIDIALLNKMLEEYKYIPQ
ncbi:tetratricopeptide repeat protein [Brenneria roseae]|uniref:O-linked N-acetylglucosamine transferase, SPINDLY family protein n=1 Tax=Brenneria roseae TaxID=1509241 RepID=UPI0014460134|nr:tetratricopeptide repeat protein [Brenneria roseae]